MSCSLYGNERMFAEEAMAEEGMRDNDSSLLGTPFLRPVFGLGNLVCRHPCRNRGARFNSSFLAIGG